MEPVLNVAHGKGPHKPYYYQKNNTVVCVCIVLNRMNRIIDRMAV
jgi:hypothetical protein